MCRFHDDQLTLEGEQESAAHIPASGGLLTVPEQQVAASVVPVMERLLQVKFKHRSQLKTCCNAWQHGQAQAAAIRELPLVGICDVLAPTARPGRSPLRWWVTEPEKLSAICRMRAQASASMFLSWPQSLTTGLFLCWGST